MTPHTTKNVTVNVNIDAIKIANRLRKDLGDIDSLAEDIKQRGLLHHIVVREEKGQMFLVAGERRLRALKQLGHTKTQVTVMCDIDRKTAIETEIAENVKSKSFNRYELVLSGAELEEIEKAKAEKRMKAGVTPANGVGKGRVDDIIAGTLDIGSGEQYRKFKVIVANKDLLTDEEFNGWCNCRDSEGFSTKKIYELIRKRTSTEQDTQEDKPTEDVSKSLRKWQSSFKSVNKSIASTIENLQHTDVGIYDQNDRDISISLIEELENCLENTQRLCNKINNITVGKDGSLTLNNPNIR